MLKNRIPYLILLKTKRNRRNPIKIHSGLIERDKEKRRERDRERVRVKEPENEK